MAGIDQSFGRAQVLQSKPYRSPGWDYMIGNKDAVKKKLDKDQLGFDELDEIKAWEDDRNFNEITGQMADLEGMWNKSFQSGYNIANPSTQDEIKLQRAFQDRKTKLKQASELYKSQGEAVKAAWGKMQTDDNVDVEATRENLKNYIDDQGDVFQRAKNIPGLVVYKTEPVDMIETVSNLISKYANVEKSVLQNAYDPETGKIKKRTWEGIPAAKRADAVDKIWQFSDDGFKDQIEGVMRSDVSNNLDPNDPADVEAYFKEEFKNVKSGGKIEETFYSIGEGSGLNISFGSGIPEKDDGGAYVSNSDTVEIYNPNAGDLQPHTSPYAINLQGVFKETPANAVSIDVTADMVNTQDGKSEVAGGIYSVLPTKIIWMPVANEDADLTAKGFDPLFFLRGNRKIAADKPISDTQMEQVREANDQLGGSGKRIGYTWEPYVMARTKYGQVETDDNIKTFNRSDYVPLSVVNNDLKAKASGMKVDWNEYEKAVKEISSQLNQGIVKPSTKKKYDY